MNSTQYISDKFERNTLFCCIPIKGIHHTNKNYGLPISKDKFDLFLKKVETVANTLELGKMCEWQEGEKKFIIGVKESDKTTDGRKLQIYEIRDQLGSGAFGEVVSVRKWHTGSKCALKTINFKRLQEKGLDSDSKVKYYEKELKKDHEFLTLFFARFNESEEAKRLCADGHIPFILSKGWIETDRMRGFLIEKGNPLAKEVHSYPELPKIEMVIQICKDILRGLTLYEKLNLYNGDIKTGNMIFKWVKDVPRIKFIDFGSAGRLPKKNKKPYKGRVGAYTHPYLPSSLHDKLYEAKKNGTNEDMYYLRIQQMRTAVAYSIFEIFTKTRFKRKESTHNQDEKQPLINAAPEKQPATAHISEDVQMQAFHEETFVVMKCYGEDDEEENQPLINAASEMPTGRVHISEDIQMQASHEETQAVMNSKEEVARKSKADEDFDIFASEQFNSLPRCIKDLITDLMQPVTPSSCIPIEDICKHADYNKLSAKEKQLLRSTLINDDLLDIPTQGSS